MSKVSTITDRIQKLAKLNGMSRKQVDKDLNNARTNFSKVKSQYDEANSALQMAQRRLDALQEKLNESKGKLVDLSDVARVMDLTGASEARDRKGAKTYMIGGKESEVDCSDVNDIKINPYVKPSKKQEDENDLSFAIDMLSEAATKIKSRKKHGK